MSTNPQTTRQHDAPTEASDPLIGTQRTTQSTAEAARAPEEEVTLARAPMGPSDKSRKIAGWIGVFLGGLGLHRFYLGYRTLGVAIAALTLLPALAVLIAGALMPQLSTAGLLFTALGVATLGIVWGLFEGVAILMGLLDHDAHGRKLAT